MTGMLPAPPSVVTVLPTYNERDNIGPLIDGILESAITPHLVLVVDDNSPDGTGDAVRAAKERWNAAGERPRVLLYTRRGEKGLTSAIQSGIDLAVFTFGAEIVTWMDCDLSMPPQDVPLLVRAIVAGADVAVGSRWIEGGEDVAHGWMARTLSRIINGYAVLLLGPAIRDYTSGFIAGRAHVFRALRLRGDYGEYCIDLLGRAARQGFRLAEVPYICVPRGAGESKTGANVWDYLVKGRKYVATVWRVRSEQA